MQELAPVSQLQAQQAQVLESAASSKALQEQHTLSLPALPLLCPLQPFLSPLPARVSATYAEVTGIAVCGWVGGDCVHICWFYTNQQLSTHVSQSFNVRPSIICLPDYCPVRFSRPYAIVLLVHAFLDWLYRSNATFSDCFPAAFFSRGPQ